LLNRASTCRARSTCMCGFQYCLEINLAEHNVAIHSEDNWNKVCMQFKLWKDVFVCDFFFNYYDWILLWLLVATLCNRSSSRRQRTLFVNNSVNSLLSACVYTHWLEITILKLLKYLYKFYEFAQNFLFLHKFILKWIEKIMEFL